MMLAKTSQVKTRLQTSTPLHHLVGSGAELPVAELPTVRDLIRYGLYLRQISEQNRRNYSIDQLVDDIMKGLLLQWNRANTNFNGPVINSPVRIKSKLKAIWEQANKVSSGRVKMEEKDKFLKKLNRLMDILTCKCEIKSCPDAGCKFACLTGVHLLCECSRHQKIPVIELEFIKGQREKVGSTGLHQIGLVDFPETKRQSLQKERQAKRKEAEEKRRLKSETQITEDEEMTEEGQEDSEDITDTAVETEYSVIVMTI